MGTMLAVARRDISWIERLGDLWCKYMHTAMTWPIHGHYLCRTCHREYAVPWEEYGPSSPLHIANTASRVIV
jgi:hypothetical protein